GLRWAGHRSVVRYLAGQPAEALEADTTVGELVQQDARALHSDEQWLGMRTRDGIPRAGIDPHRLGPLAAAGLIEVEEDRIRPTAKGLLFADEIGVRLLQ